ncbi:hypothetical protein ACJ73_03032 [Blastomyces percursus]|uniref:DUF6570 domain-containing protein n=1 Tax=Blastomyces percursus TaxID=1658174 RepID=A0A1J9QZJ4_9EURO|nr:hypothetical protein ACJ73_03032 [Blastomyces percursus]
MPPRRVLNVSVSSRYLNFGPSEREHPLRSYAYHKRGRNNSSLDDSDIQPRSRVRHQQPEFLFRGINSSDSPKHAEARHQQTVIRCENRFQRRHGMEPPATPSILQLRRDSPSARQTHDVPDSSPSAHEIPLQAHIRTSISSSPRSITPTSLRTLRPVPSPSPIRFVEGSQSGNSSQGYGTTPASSFTDPPMLPPNNPQRVDAPALSECDWELLTAFHKKIGDIKMEECDRCHANWFNMNLQHGVCGTCRHADNPKRRQDGPYLYSAANRLHPGDVPPELPQLSQTEEMLIARIHICVQVCQVRGHQYKYRGHIVHFLQNTRKMTTKLPHLPRDLDIILLRPRNADTNPRRQHQFRNDFRVRRLAVFQWLRYLRANHPGYSDISVDEEAVESLPADGDVSHHFQATEIDLDDEPASPQPSDQPRTAEDVASAAVEGETENELPPEYAGVPDVIVTRTELEQLREEISNPSPLETANRPPTANLTSNSALQSLTSSNLTFGPPVSSQLTFGPPITSYLTSGAPVTSWAHWQSLWGKPHLAFGQ